jgi:DNA modification methylase
MDELLFKVHNRDCLDFMQELPNACIDVILTDPPFFAPAVHYQSRISWGRCFGDLSILGQAFFDWCREFKRILKPDGHLLCFCNAGSYPVFFPVAYGWWDFTNALVWDKTRVGLGKVFRHQYELILWASNKGAFVKSDGVLHADVLAHPATLSKDRAHPVEKPPALLRELLSVVARDGATVFDPFAGGGSSILAAHQGGFKWLGCEININYCQVIKQMLAEEFGGQFYEEALATVGQQLKSNMPALQGILDFSEAGTSPV